MRAYGSVLRLAALAVLWGSGFLFIKIALEGLSPIQIVLGRVATAAVFMVALLVVRGEHLPRQVTHWLHLTAMAITTNIAPYFLYGWAEERITSSLAGVLNATTPLFTLLFAVSTRTEHLTMRRLFGLLLGFVGVVILAAPWHDSGLSTSLAGVGAALLASAFYAASYVYARRFLTGRDLPAIVLSTGQMVAGTVLVGAFAPLVARQPVTLDPYVVASVIVLGVLGTGVAYVFNYRLIADEGATAASTVTYLIPIVAVASGAVLLSEHVTWNLLVGAMVVLIGVASSEGRIGVRDHRRQVRREVAE